MYLICHTLHHEKYLCRLYQNSMLTPSIYRIAGKKVIGNRVIEIKRHWIEKKSEKKRNGKNGEKSNTQWIKSNRKKERRKIVRGNWYEEYVIIPKRDKTGVASANIFSTFRERPPYISFFFMSILLRLHFLLNCMFIPKRVNMTVTYFGTERIEVLVTHGFLTRF